jgi:hypothetical protein
MSSILVKPARVPSKVRLRATLKVLDQTVAEMPEELCLAIEASGLFVHWRSQLESLCHAGKKVTSIVERGGQALDAASAVLRIVNAVRR